MFKLNDRVIIVKHPKCRDTNFVFKDEIGKVFIIKGKAKHGMGVWFRTTKGISFPIDMLQPYSKLAEVLA